MSTSSSVSFKAASDKVWGAVIKLITSANYAITKTDQGAKQIVFQASGGVWAYKQSVQVSVTGIDEDETMVTTEVHATYLPTLTQGGQQRKLINFIIDSLRKKFQLADNQKSLSYGAGASEFFGWIIITLISTAGFVGLWWSLVN